MNLTRDVLAQHICARLDRDRERLREHWQASEPINHFVIDELLPAAWTEAIRTAFPPREALMERRSLREHKLVTAQMDRCHPLLEESIYAFQAAGVIERVEQITALAALEPDELLYAGGISVMAPGHFLNPHIDNSHDKFRRRYRVLNLLFYVSPGWQADDGGNLELWPEGPQGRPVTIVSRFNRLAVMVTHPRSWHSVSRNLGRQDRCCISNYYFSKHPVGEQEYFHVTSFRGRPEQPLRDLALRADVLARTLVRKAFPRGIRGTRHFYQRRDADRP